VGVVEREVVESVFKVESVNEWERRRVTGGGCGAVSGVLGRERKVDPVW
jgi:hypothetical protein